MATSPTEYAKKGINALIERMQEYLDLRYAQFSRVNPRIEGVWPDLAWQSLQQLRQTYENTKAWGPNRFCVGAILVSDDLVKIRDLFSVNHQSSIMAEVIERDDPNAKGKDASEVNDMRSLYTSLEPSVSGVVSLIQFCMWWDMEDAVDLTRFDFKMESLGRLRRGQLPEGAAAEYHRRMHRREEEPHPTVEEIVKHEVDQVRRIVERFTERRANEPGFKMIIARRKSSAADQLDRLIGIIAREQVLLTNLEAGKEVDEGLKAQFAKALQVSVDALDAKMERDYLQRMVTDHKRQLRSTMTDQAGGIPYNFKEAQAEVIRDKYKVLMKQLTGEDSRESQEKLSLQSPNSDV
ncbi:MAG: hypothetical protein RLY93_07950 [Sumerlaeia bacterium]